jgi:hypothetical protein
MQKITAKYMMWKVIICFLTQIMAAAAGVPFLMICMANGLEGSLISLLLSGGCYLIFLYLQHQLMKRSDLSGISKKNYLLGESLAYLIIALFGSILLAVLSKGIVPCGISYYTVAFSCGYFASYAVNNLLLGLPLQTLLFVLSLKLLYFIKKKKDPTLKGVKKLLPVTGEAQCAPTNERAEAGGKSEENTENEAPGERQSEKQEDRTL